ncbi:Probable LIM domain-containing serine/threonine-protein kinase DDB [Seminavis robusta]|uniref:Probable LIM domain-containing serine/threonine-protein kinase DDB n=1 Tax=Seminavis robusta TaxID=568900 RepID=A0A9N8DYJ6_9STRA|nr:Probable LIM domain-containing serine/threonine-protein kinase DDB [Seminavis robusta]|eukprot:Sro448_g145210.1 Probable LIM domain-containing serine/threonine-protein kinase DDB (426) ;mRNA; r:49337-50614
MTTATISIRNPKDLASLKSKNHRASLRGLRCSLMASEEQRVALLNLASDANLVGSSMEETSRFIKASAQTCIPKFSTEEVVVGELVGKGGFNVIFALDAVVLRDDSSSSCDSQRPTDAEAKQRESDEFRFRQDRQLQERRLAFASTVNQHKDNHQYVVKFLVPDLKLNKLKSGALDLVREAKMMASMEHKNIITLRGLAEDSAEGHFLVMDRLSETLLERLTRWKRTHRTGPLQAILKSKKQRRHSMSCFFLQRFNVLLELASAFVYLHSINVVYKDGKLENCGFAQKDGCLKLFDFGLAKELHKYPRVSPDSNLYHVGSFGGTHPYIAPEIAKGQPYGLSADVYTFSIICFEVLTMREPFANLMEDEYADRVVFGNQRPRLPKTSSTWSPELKQLLAECWSPDADARPTMDQVLSRLQGIRGPF